MEEDRPDPELYKLASANFRDHRITGSPSVEDRTLYVMIEALAGQVATLTSRVDELEAAAYQAGAGENTIDWEALDEADRNDPAKQWTPEDEATYQAELPRTLPHQP